MRSLIHIRSAALLDLHALTQFDSLAKRFEFSPRLLGYILDLRSRFDRVIGVYFPETLDWGVGAAEALEAALALSVVYLPPGGHGPALDALYGLRRDQSLDLGRSVLYTHMEKGEPLLMEYVTPEVRCCRHLPGHLTFDR